MSKRAGVKIRSTVYQTFRGVDFTTDPSLVDKTRSPLATNMISDEGGNPEKRPGYERISAVEAGAEVYGIYSYYFDPQKKLNKVYTKDGTAIQNNIYVDVEKCAGKTEGYGATEITLVKSSTNVVLTVECGDYTETKTFFDGEIVGQEDVYKYLERVYGITGMPYHGASDTLTFTTRKCLTTEKHLIVHCGHNIYRVYEDGTKELLLDLSISVIGLDLPAYEPKKSSAVYIGGYMMIFTGTYLICYDGVSMDQAANNAYVPLTLISCDPGATPGGVTYEGINYLSSSQRVGFKGNGSAADFHLPYTDINEVLKVTVGGVVKTQGTHYNVNLTTGVVTFTSGNIPPAPAAGAADNVEIEFYKPLNGYMERINCCTMGIAWGVNGASDRIVCTGNPDYPNQDFISGYNNGLYFPDTNYQVVGSGATGIVGYRRIGDQLAIIKEDNGQDSTVFLRSGSLDTSGNAIWSTYPCLSGVGGVSQFGFGNIGDDQLVLTGNGIYAITSNYTTAEKIAEMRSKYLNPELVKEDLSNAHCVNFRNMMLTFFPNGHVYILDGRQAKAYSTRNETVFNYEGYYWENCPATYVFVDVENGIEQMYFGTSNGKLMKFMWDEGSLYKYSDGGYFSNGAWTDGTAITAIWATKADDDGDPMVLKTMLKKGNAVTLKPYARSSAKVCMRTDKDASEWQVNEDQMDIFDWEDIDFSRFTFESNDAPREVPFNRKVKNYKRLQIIVKNDTLNEGFGVYGIVKHYVVGNFAKG